MKKQVAEIIRKALKKLGVSLKVEDVEKRMELPPSVDMGDFSFPVFFLVEKTKMMPNELAIKLRESIGNISETDFDDVQTSGGYVNFFIDRKNMARKVVWEAITQKDKYGKSKVGAKKKIVIEYSSPNIAKPFGVGHLRSTIIGNSIANMAEFLGYKPIRINYLGDWGTQFGKLIYAFNEWGNEDKILKKPIEHLMKLYVKANKYKKYEAPSREEFMKLEKKERKSMMLWKLFRQLSIQEFQKIYKQLGVKFDIISGESESVKYTQKVIDELNEKELLKKSKGAMIVDLNQYNLGVVLIQKTDGSTLYATRDLAEAVKRYEKYKFEQMIYEVGQEQKLYFQQLFKVLELMGYKWASKCVHVDHGLYLGKDGKKFSTRKGKTVIMQDILDETANLAKKEIKKRFPGLSKAELEKRAAKIAIAAIFYGDLKNNRTNNMIFDLKKFTSFDGNTGPYIQYTYARAGSIVRKAKDQEKFEIIELNQQELGLVKKLSQFSEVVADAFEHLNPSTIANYCYSICQKFNEFYESSWVIDSGENEPFRLALVESFRQILKNGMSLLGIDMLEEM